MRRVYVYDVAVGHLVDVTEAARRAPEPRVHVLGDRGFENLRATDGADISSRTKWEAYRRARGLTHMSDFDKPGGYWDRAAARRLRIATGTDPENNFRLKSAVVESYNKLRDGYRPPPVERVADDVPVLTPTE